MLLVQIAIVAGIFGGANASQSTQSPVPAKSDTWTLPPASGPLMLQWDRGCSYNELIAELGKLTGISFVMDPIIAEQAGERLTLLPRDKPVHAGEVYTFLEGLLSVQKLRLGLLNGGEHPLMGVYSLNSTNGIRGAPLLTITEAQVERYAPHSALLVSLTATFQHLDARQAVKGLRGMSLRHEMTMLPVGDHSICMVGSGRSVASMMSVLRTADTAPSNQPPKKAKPAKDESGG